MKLEEEHHSIFERLRKVRLYLKFSQQEVAEKTNLTQYQITRMENAKTCSINVLLRVLSFYSKYIYIDSLFDEQFEIIQHRGDITKVAINSIAYEKLKVVKEVLDKKKGKLNEMALNVLLDMDQDLTKILEYFKK